MINILSCQRDKKIVGHENDGDTNHSWSTWNSLKAPSFLQLLWNKW